MESERDNTFTIGPMWPEVFIKGHAKYDDKRIAVADAFIGWSICMSGFAPTLKFGEGMVFIGQYLGDGKIVNMSPDGLKKYCEENGID